MLEVVVMVVMVMMVMNSSTHTHTDRHPLQILIQRASKQAEECPNRITTTTTTTHTHTHTITINPSCAKQAMTESTADHKSALEL